MRETGNRPLRALIVDDDFRVAEIHAGFVADADGFAVAGTALTGKQAIELSRELEPDLILLDIYLPDANGTDLLAALRTERSVDCFVLTAARDVATVKRCLDLGALHYLIKPFSGDDLLDRLAAYRRWRRRLDDEAELDQREVDQLFHPRSGSGPSLPKGLSAETMGLVVGALDDAIEPLGADDVAELTGISQVSVRRYLRHLADSGDAELLKDYGAPGRPRHRFRLVRPG